MVARTRLWLVVCSTANFRGSSSDLEGQSDDNDYAAGKSKVVPAYANEASVATLFQMGGVVALIGAFLFYRSTPSTAPIIFVYTLCCEGLIFSYWLARAVLSKVPAAARRSCMRSPLVHVLASEQTRHFVSLMIWTGRWHGGDACCL